MMGEAISGKEILMKFSKRILTMCLIAILALSCAVVPVAAAATTRLTDFYNFPQASRGTTYKPQTVAVQRFLMSYDDEYWGPVLDRHGGTDGKFGDKTFEFVKEYQALKELNKKDGVVGPETWTQICYDINEVGVDSIGPVFYCNKYDVLYTDVDSTGNGYVAVTDSSDWTRIFYYFGVG